MESNNFFISPHNRLAKLRAFCYSVALWGMVILLCLTALILLRLALSTGAQNQLLQLLNDHPFLVGVSALLPLSAAGALMIYLLHYRHTCYTFHSSLLAYDVDPQIMASTIETSWNNKHSELPIKCEVTTTGRSLKVAITAPPPPEIDERDRAEQLHVWTMDQLHSLLVTKHPITFQIQWTKPSLTQYLFDTQSTPNA